MNQPTILTKILSVKKEELAHQSYKTPLNELRSRAADSEEVRGFKQKITTQVNANKAGIIAEIKKASPSKGLIRPDFHPASLAASYEEGGATCLSVLTDVNFFQGSIDYLQEAKKSCALPVLRKDFIISPYQVYQSRALGADCILLIVAALEKNQLEDLFHTATETGLDVLVEVHNKEELETALPLKEGMTGINNRNLHTFETTLETTYDLLPHIPDKRLVITESGISKKEDVVAMFQNGVKAFLIGESFMRAENPGEKVTSFFKGYL
ncbi:MAG: indole-3-glycerol phosphate synthase TrpC [Endozoicomonadaceae bacterium]|nr:indole-3-glycerol phosphate synthase TrpC [Endozoicomonadaceae bacterium]